jgi:hypothetical protein
MCGCLMLKNKFKYRERQILLQPSTAGLYPCHGAGIWTTPTLMLQEPTTLTTDRGVKRPCFRDLVKVNG